MRDAHQGAPVVGLPLGDWRGDEPEPPVSPPPAPIASAGAPLAINKIGQDMAGPPTGRGSRPVPPALVPQGAMAPATPREKNILEKLLGQL